MKRNSLTLVVLLLTSFFPIQCLASDAPTRTALESAWKVYLQAAKSGKIPELEKATSSFRFATMKNDLAKAGRTLTPEMMESIAETAPDMTGARFVRVMEKGPTAALVYVKDADWKDATGKPRVEFIFLKFVNEGGAWKVDGGMTSGCYKYTKEGKEADFDASSLAPPFLIDGKVAEAPKSTPLPEVVGSIDVDSYEYRTEVTVNGIEQKPTVNQSSSRLIAGGLRRGTNSIVVTFTRMAAEARFRPGVKVRRLLADGETEECFAFEPKDKIAGTHTLSFTVK